MATVQRTGTGVSAEFAEKNNNVPVIGIDIVNKDYADAIPNSISTKGSVRMATTGALPAYTYANGSSGVGATITANAFGALPAQDGVTPTVGMRLLVKDETAGNLPYNGIYVVTVVGDGGTKFVLTRATDADTTTKLAFGTVTFVGDGTTLRAKGYIMTTTGAITIGASNIVWEELEQVLASGGLTKSGNSILIATSGVTNAKLANMNDQTFKGNISGAPAAPSDLTAAQVAAALPAATTSVQGMVILAANNVVASNQVVVSTDSRIGPGVGTWIYGAGLDSSLSIAGDTVITADHVIQSLTSLTLNGFTLSIASTNTYLLLYINGTAAFGTNGKVTTNAAGFATPAGGLGGGGDANTGGVGGLPRASLFFYAQTMTGTGSVDSAGQAGGNGGNATGANVNGNGAGGGTAVGNVRYFGTNRANVAPLTGGGSNQTASAPPSGANGAAGAAGTLSTSAPTDSIIKDLIQILFRGDQTSPAGTTAARSWSGGSGGPGGGAAHQNAGAGNAHCAGAGGGGGASSVCASGGAGGLGGDVGAAKATEIGGGGGGGGGGGSGGLVVVWCDSVASTITVTAAGGTGGNGGNATGAAAANGGGACGGGGAGGIAILVGNSGNTATVTAAGGAHGTTVGTGSNGGASGATGNNGGAGQALNLSLAKQ